MLHYQVIDRIVPQGDYILVNGAPLGEAARRRTEFRRAVIAINKMIAGLLGLDPHHTVSTNIAWRWSLQTGVPFEDAKRAFHAQIARDVTHALIANGIVHASPALLSHMIFDWLESFDSSNSW